MDITANMVTTSQLDTWMQAAVQRVLATVDEWCYAMSDILKTNGCPALDPAGTGIGTGMDSVFVCGGMNADGSNRTSLPQISSGQFLNCLRTAQLAVNAANPLPGGNPGVTGTATGLPSKPAPPAPGGAPSTTTPPVGTGVLGLTNCTVCQTLASNPIMLLVLAVAMYFLFFK